MTNDGRPGDVPPQDAGSVEEELRRRQEQLRLILDGVRDHAISMLDAEGRIETFNAPAEQIKGYALAEVKGQSFAIFFTPDDRAAGVPEKELETARTVGRFEGEGWRQRKDGSLFYAAVSLSALHDSSGKLIGFVKVTQDRTRQRELRAAIQRREQQLRLILDGVRDHAISMLDSKGRIETLNAPAERIKGYALDEVRGRYFGIFFTPEDQRAGLPEHELETARTKGRFDGEGWRQRKDGSLFYATVSLSALHDASGTLIGFVKVTQDRTRQRELDEALHRREQELQLTIDAIPGLVEYVSPSQRYRLANRAYKEWFDLDPAEVRGKHLAEVLGDAAYAVVRPHVETALRGQPASFEATVPYARAGTRCVRATYVPDVGTDGTVHGCVGLVLDVTEARRTEQQLADAARVTETLYRIGSALAQDLDLDAIVQRLTDEATTLCRAQFGAFFYNVVNAAGESYMLYTLAGVPRDAFANFPMPRNTAIFAPTFSGASVVRSDDITQDPRYGRSAPHHGMPAGHLPVRSYLAVPVVSRSGEVHGGLFFGHASVGVFTDRDERVLVAVAAQAAVALDNARLHAQVARAEQQYRALTESSPQLIWTTRANGMVEYCNQGFVDFVGVALERMQRETVWNDIVHADDVPRATEAWTSAVRTGEPYEVEYRLRRAADGAYLWFLARGVPIKNEAGEITRWVGTCTDIDVRRRIEDTQRFLADAGAALSASLDVRVTLATVAGLAVPKMADWCAIDVLGANGAIEQLGVAHVEPAKVALAHELHGRYPPQPDDAVARIVRTGKAELIPEVTDAMLEAGARDATHLQMIRELGLRSWMAAPIVAQNRTLGVISFASAESGRHFEPGDLTIAEEIGRRAGTAIENARLFELAQTERIRAEEASRAKDQFLGTLSHELRTPLNAILGWTRMLRAGTLAEDKRERALETIDRNARAQVALIEDILDVSRIITGKMRLSVSPVDVVPIVEAALETIRPAADAKGVRLQAILDPDAGVLHGDATRLQQVIWNLLSNAVKFTPKGGRVYARLQRIDSQIEIIIADDGQGIDPAFLPRVFERFMQADNTATRQQSGLGLGLAIVRHLVELHGGTVHAESGGVGKGATFIVRLPVAPLRVTASPALAPLVMARPGIDLHCPPELEGLDVLVVDDEADARELLRSVLESCKARVRTAASVADAMERFHESPPDVLVSDVGMPGEDGYTLIRRVRALPAAQGGRVPAVAVTAYVQLADRTRALLEGYTSHVSKPTEPQELLAVIAALLGRHRAT